VIMIDETNLRGKEYYCTLRWCFMSIMVYLVLGILGWGYYVFVFIISLPMFNDGYLLLPCASLIGWHIIFVILVVTYLRCVFTDPGSVPTSILNIEDFEGEAKECKVCLAVKPDRTHHCSICNRCVLKMDHHCPWICNCVGFRNYKFFILFLIYTPLLCSYFAVFTIPFLINLGKVQEMSGNEIQVIVAFMISISFGLGLVCFAGQHIHFALTNQTTLESFGKRKPNPFDLGKKKNWEQVFGADPFLWFLPVLNPVGDGYHFETNNRNEIV